MGVIRFGVEGWRDRVDKGFDEAHVVRVARALGETWARRYAGATLRVGYDTRRDSERLAVIAGQVMAASGMRVLVSDRACPTPAVAWATAQDADGVGAVVITASGASHAHNGILVRQHDGGPVNASFADAVERAIAGRPTDARGPVERCDMVSGYVASLVEQVQGTPIDRPTPRIVVDPMYGAGTSCAIDLFEQLGCEVIGLHGQPVSDFRGLHPRAHEPWVDECERCVVENKADLGIVLDGDADRVGIIDEKGRMVSQHDLAPLAMEYLTRVLGEQGRVVATFATSSRVRRQAELLECPFTMVPVGFDAIYREFIEGDVMLAVDERGDLTRPMHLRERDGLLAGCLVAFALLSSDNPASEEVARLAQRLGRTEWGNRTIPLDPASLQRLNNMLPGTNPREVAGKEPVTLSHAGGLRLGFEDGSWLLVVPSARRSAAVIAAEAPTSAEMRTLLEGGARIVRSQP